MPNKNKQKGKRFEDKISEIIRKEWNLSKDEVHRAQSSGTFKSDYSDIIIRPFNYKIPHIVIECKYYNRKYFTYSKILNPLSFLNEVWEQIKESKEKYKKEYNIEPFGMIVYATTNVRPMVAIESDELYNLQVTYGKEFNIEFDEEKMNNTITWMMTLYDINTEYTPNPLFNIFYFDEFIRNIKLINK